MTKITVNGHTFVIQQIRKHQYALGRALGGNCVDIFVDPELKECVLFGVEYGVNCSESGDMPHTETKTMVKAALQWISTRYSDETFKRVEFDDNSYFQCNRNMRMPLANHHVLLYGRTWYQRHFGARSNNPLLEQSIAEYHTRLSLPIDITFENFCRWSKPESNSNIEMLKEIWNKRANQSWHHLFRAINRKIGCEFFACMPRLISKLGIADLNLKRWFIPRNTVQSWNMPIQIQRGGSLNLPLRERVSGGGNKSLGNWDGNDDAGLRQSRGALNELVANF